ncbi:hypothetical protein AB4262_10725 [Vibrio breoganii]
MTLLTQLEALKSPQLKQFQKELKRAAQVEAAAPAKVAKAEMELRGARSELTAVYNLASWTKEQLAEDIEELQHHWKDRKPFSPFFYAGAYQLLDSKVSTLDELLADVSGDKEKLHDIYLADLILHHGKSWSGLVFKRNSVSQALTAPKRSKELYELLGCPGDLDKIFELEKARLELDAVTKGLDAVKRGQMVNEKTLNSSNVIVADR